MMLRCSVVACLLAIAVAQTPTKPVFSESFFASGEVELHVGKPPALFGEFKMARDQQGMMGMEESSFEEHPNGGYSELLQRYDLKKTYYIRSESGEDRHCAPINSSSSVLTPFWRWLDIATYEGERDFRHRPHYIWGATVADVRFEVGIDKETPTVPVFFNRLSAEEFFFFGFKSYNATTPPSDYFKVPSECNSPNKGV